MNRTVLIPEYPSTSGGGRCGRHVNHDPRSKNYPVTASSSPLTSVTHARHVPIYDQGDLGSCVPHAGKGVLSTAPFTHRYTSEPGIVKTYEQLTAVDDVPGYYKPGDPASQDTGSDGLSFAKYAATKGWCSRYLHAFSITAMLTALQTTPVMCGTSWLTGMDDPDPSGLVTVAGESRGGHEYEAFAYLMRGTVRDDTEDLIGFCNSWGIGWGAAGRFYVTVSQYAGLLAQDGDVTVLIP